VRDWNFYKLPPILTNGDSNVHYVQPEAFKSEKYENSSKDLRQLLFSLAILVSALGFPDLSSPFHLHGPQ